MQYCYKCGQEIQNLDARCRTCNARVFGMGNHMGLIDSIGKSLGDETVGKTDNEIKDDYYKSDYYRFTKESMADVFRDKGKIGEYAVEGWLKGKHGETRAFPPIRYPFWIIYNLMVPEPDGSFQEIDMVILTQYAIHVVEVKNRHGKLHFNRWTDAECEISGEKIYSPIIQNDNHITALRHYLHEKGMDESSIPIYNSVAISPVMELDVSFEYDLFDHIIVDSNDMWCGAYMYLGNIVNKAVEQSINDKAEKLNTKELYDILTELTNSVGWERSLNMRLREEYLENESKKHAWEYFLYGKDKTSDQIIVRNNGVYRQYMVPYLSTCWCFVSDDSDDYFSRFKTQIARLDKIKDIVGAYETIHGGQNYEVKYTQNPVKDTETKNDNKQSGGEKMLKYCPNCGEKINPVKFCPCCGYKL